eukprot:611154-Pelagomonas_calceolata.AAC.1
MVAVLGGHQGGATSSLPAGFPSTHVMVLFAMCEEALSLLCSHDAARPSLLHTHTHTYTHKHASSSPPPPSSSSSSSTVEAQTSIPIIPIRPSQVVVGGGTMPLLAKPQAAQAPEQSCHVV